MLTISEILAILRFHYTAISWNSLYADLADDLSITPQQARDLYKWYMQVYY